ncbi:MAG: hypothetical protein J5762_03020 [Clostridia bacterium]|nr:hypothetical protein [Clostridia bacterium]
MKNTLKPIEKTGELFYVFGTILCSLGVCLSAKSGFGVSMVVAPAYVLSCFLQPKIPFFTFGNTEYVVQGIFIIVLALAVGKFKLKYPLSFVTCVIYGLMLDGWRALFKQEIYAEMHMRIISMILGAVITAIAIALYLRTYLPQQGYDMFVYEVATEKKLKMNVVKWVYDVCSLILAIALMLILFGRFDLEMVGIGTLILTLVNTPLIIAFGKLLDKIFVPTPAFKGFAEKLFSYRESDETSTSSSSAPAETNDERSAENADGRR